jgi:hypothetical protein
VVTPRCPDSSPTLITRLRHEHSRERPSRAIAFIHRTQNESFSPQAEKDFGKLTVGFLARTHRHQQVPPRERCTVVSTCKLLQLGAYDRIISRSGFNENSRREAPVRKVSH